MEAIDLTEVEHVVDRVWVSGPPGHHRHVQVAVGRLVDGRYWAGRAGRRWSGVWAAHDERQACDAVTSWMRRRGGVWVQVPVPAGEEPARPR